MKRLLPILLITAIFTAVAPVAGQIPRARIGDITHLQGEGTNVLVGQGLVTGLNGTGDGGKYLPTMNALARMMARFGVAIESLDDVRAAKNVAIVTIEAIIPEHGAREGELIDVHVTAHAAKSLAGGRLLSTPLIYHDRTVDGLFGFAQGTISIIGETPTAGVVRGGARMEKDVMMTVIATGSELRANGHRSPWIRPNETYITLVLDNVHAGWPMAAAVAQAVDKELSISAEVERVALALDSKSIAVLLPSHQRSDPASWIRDVQVTPVLMESNEARVTINRNTSTIVVTGDTRISDVVVSQLGMTITVANPLPDGSTLPPPAFEEHDFVALDDPENRLPNVQDLLQALNRLKVPFKDRVAILEEIHRAGKLHARILYEG